MFSARSAIAYGKEEDYIIGDRHAKFALRPDRALLGSISIVTSLTDTVEAVCDLMADNSADPRVIQRPVM
jgi:hypothetical protein